MCIQLPVTCVVFYDISQYQHSRTHCDSQGSPETWRLMITTVQIGDTLTQLPPSDHQRPPYFLRVEYQCSKDGADDVKTPQNISVNNNTVNQPK